MPAPPLLLSCFDRTARWMRRGGAQTDVVLSSRVRLARNLRRFEFPHLASASSLLTVRHHVLEAVHDTRTQRGGMADVRLLPFEEFTTWERQSLVDRHLTSREHVKDEVARAVAAVADASLSLLINEEDHLRMQALLPGLQLHQAHALADRLDDVLEERLDRRASYAFSAEFGYITACPTNLGTGMRASVMLHLPGLEIARRLERATKWAESQGLALRGTFGEGSRVWANLYQLSNQATLGLAEREVLAEVERGACELCRMEREARASISGQLQSDAEDRIGRAYGMLRYARRISGHEASDALSWLRLGEELGLVSGLSRQRFCELLVWLRPAYLQVLHGRTLSGEERDRLRADLLRPHVYRARFKGVTEPCRK